MSSVKIEIDKELADEIESIPLRLNFKIGDVANLVGVKPYVLRYWEKEFGLLNPGKSSTNQRMYSRKDVENVFLIRKLLYRDRFSIEGAKNALASLKTEVKNQEKFQKVLISQDKVKLKLQNLITDIANVRKSLTIPSSGNKTSEESEITPSPNQNIVL